MILYFAYGANLSRRAMARRCPRCEPVGPATLSGYRLSFRQYACIEPDRAGTVTGALYRLTPACERALDAYEDFPRLYGKTTLTVAEEGENRLAMVYTMNADVAGPIAPPSPDYYRILVHGYRDWGLDEARLRAARLRAGRGR